MTWFTDLGTWAEISTISASVAVLVTTGFVWRQVALQKKGVDLEERALRRESITLVHKTLLDEEFLAMRKDLFGKANLETPAVIDAEHASAAKKLLGTYGLLARMVDHGALDDEVYRGIWKTSFLRDWERLLPFVESERDARENPRLYTAAESTYDKWKDDRGRA